MQTHNLKMESIWLDSLSLVSTLMLNLTLDWQPPMTTAPSIHNQFSSEVILAALVSFHFFSID